MKKATRSEEQSRPHGNDSTHLDYLEPLIVKYMEHANSPWPFASAQSFVTGLGFTRDEVVTAINNLVDAGTLRFRVRTLHHVQPHARVAFELELVEQGGEV